MLICSFIARNDMWHAIKQLILMAAICSILGGQMFGAGIDFQNKLIIGICSVNQFSAFNDLKKFGFNCAHTYEQKQDYLGNYIKEAQKNGLFTLMYPSLDYRTYHNENCGENIKKFISNNKSPNVIWYLADEPDLKITDYSAQDAIASLQVIIKKADPNSSTAFGVSTPDKFKDYIDIPDIFVFGVYPIGMPCKGKYGVKNVSYNTRLAVEAAGGRKPVWAVLQAFGYQNEKNKAWGWEREPTYEEERAMTYLAIINGAKGILYYTYHGSQYYIEDSPKHWAEIKSIVAELNELSPAILSPIDRSITLDDGNKNKSIEFTARYYNNKTYLFAVNTEEEPVKAKITGGFKSCKVYGGDKINIKNGGIENVFQPLETKLYICKN